MIYSPLEKTNNPTIYLNTPIRTKKVIYLETAEGIKALQGECWAEETLDICFIQLDPDLFTHLLDLSTEHDGSTIQNKRRGSRRTDQKIKITN